MKAAIFQLLPSFIQKLEISPCNVELVYDLASLPQWASLSRLVELLLYRLAELMKPMSLSMPSSLRGRRDGLDKEPRVSWESIPGPSDEEHLITVLLDMYWDGVHRELKHILLTLVMLQDVDLSDMEMECRNDTKTVDYATFIDQICAMPRYYADPESLYSIISYVGLILNDSRYQSAAGRPGRSTPTEAPSEKESSPGE